MINSLKEQNSENEEKGVSKKNVNGFSCECPH